jgi:hypothetical protein
MHPRSPGEDGNAFILEGSDTGSQTVSKKPPPPCGERAQDSGR